MENRNNKPDYNPAGIEKDLVSLNQEFEHTNTEKYYETVKLSSGEYSQHGVRYTIERRTTGYVWRVYLPVALSVLASFLPFFLNKNLALPRVTLGGLVLLALFVFVGLVSALITPSVG